VADDAWAKNFSECTNLLKHSEKEYIPEPFEELMVVDKAIFYLRVTLPLILGCHEEALAGSVSLDRQNPIRFRHEVRVDPKDLKLEISNRRSARIEDELSDDL